MMKKIFLYPGQLHLTQEKCVISTILGSCISIILIDRNSGTCGMCHYLIPKNKMGPSNNPRYGEFAIPHLIKGFEKTGIDLSYVEAEIFGGGSVVSQFQGSWSQVGQKNIDCAKKILKESGISIKYEDIGGQSGRKIYLDTSNFTVESQLMRSSSEGSQVSSRISQLRKKIKVLIVDDSATARAVFSKALSKSRDIQVVGVAIDPFDAREKIIGLKPDVVTLDIEMPRMNGVSFLEKVMKHHPLPIIMVSSLGADGRAAQKSLELGAVEFIQKPSQFDPRSLSQLGAGLIPKVLAAASISKEKILNKAKQAYFTTVASKIEGPGKIEVIFIGGNTGANRSIETIIEKLAHDSPPVLISCSTISPLIYDYVKRLQERTRLNLTVLSEETVIKDGYVYFAPPNDSLTLLRRGQQLACHPLGGQGKERMASAFDRLLEAASELQLTNAMAVLLSGFGSDGIKGLIKLRELKVPTVVESPDTAVCSSLPNAALDKGAADHVLPAAEITTFILKMRNLSVT